MGYIGVITHLLNFSTDEILINPLFRVIRSMGVFCSFMGSDIFLFQPSNDFVEQPKFPHPVCVFCGGRRGKILPCVFPDWGLLVWKYFSVEFFPFRRNASLLAKKSEGGGVQTVVFSAGCRSCTGTNLSRIDFHQNTSLTLRETFSGGSHRL